MSRLQEGNRTGRGSEHSHMEATPRELPVASERDGVPPLVSLVSIYVVAFRIGAFSFGGGLSAWIHFEAVQRHKWINEGEFLSALALGQALPGANVINLLIYIGNRLRGFAGAVVASVGLLTVPFFVVIGLAALYAHFSGLEWLQTFLDGAAAAAIGLMIVVIARGTVRALRDPASVLMLVATVVGVTVLRWPLPVVVLCVTPLSVALAWLKVRRRA